MSHSQPLMPSAFAKRSCICLATLIAACAGATGPVTADPTAGKVGVRGRVVRACDGQPFPGAFTAVFSGAEGRQLGAASSAPDGTFFIPLPANQRGSLYFAQTSGAVRLFDGAVVEQGTELIVLAPCPRANQP
jgi:hypothetical protein